SSRRRPCLRLVLLLISIAMNIKRFSYRGLSPHKFTPMPGVHKALHRTAIPLRSIAAGELGRSPLRFAPGGMRQLSS
ncbi:MAG: hypothetical protein AB1632_14735, partial [Nitrospirota bacterium]